MGTKRIKWIIVTVMLVMLAISAQLQADVFSYAFEDADWVSPDWTLVGSAGWADDGSLDPPKRLRTTWQGEYLSGAAWLNVREIYPQQDWSVFVRGQFSTQINGGADGMALVI